MSLKEQFAQIQASYQEGENSTTVSGRQEHFNNSVKMMQELHSDSGEFNYDIGNGYYQLEQYPWALFYYLKARKELPRDAEVKQNIQATLQKLEIKKPVPDPLVPLALKEELLILQVLILLTTLFISGRIWISNAWFKRLSQLSVAMTLMIFVLIGIQHYSTPEQGIVAKAAILYKNPGIQYERALLDPISPGSILEVIGESEQGEWTKVSTQEGLIGYIQSNKLLL